MLTKINNTNPNFQGLKIQTLKAPLRQIDIYSINKSDKEFIDKMLNIVKGHELPKDKFILGGDTSREVYDAALKRAKNLNDYEFDKVLIAVENNKKITGLINIKENGDMNIQGITTLNSDKTTLKTLITAAINETKKLKDFALIVPEKSISVTMKKIFREMGFKIPEPKYNKDMVIECEDLGVVGKKLNSDMKFPTRKTSKNLSELFSD